MNDYAPQTEKVTLEAIQTALRVVTRGQCEYKKAVLLASLLREYKCQNPASAMTEEELLRATQTLRDEGRLRFIGIDD